MWLECRVSLFSWFKTGNILVIVRELFDSFHDCSTYTVLRVVVVLKIYKMGCL
jgi:hypothetical protein